ncbi:MAG TPA: glutamate--cysteine ligase [Mycobacteriales bacterium]|jgi:carboxylate-amine ligase
MARTVGVEEEYLLMRGASPELAPTGDAVVESASDTSDGQFEHELRREQVELGTDPHESLADLEADLRHRRAELAQAGERRGTRLAALAISPLDDWAPAPTPEERYERMSEQFGIIARTELSCGMHVHVSVDSPDEGVAVVDRLQPWLAVLAALSANSPYLHGEDTGYASYRRILWGQWPTAGPTEPFGDVAGYERARAAMVVSGAAIDDGMIYFDARLSTRYPTVEVRVADVCPDAADAVTIAALTRGLVSTVAADWANGRDAVGVRHELLRAASWRAARYGIDGDLLDVVSTRLVPAFDLIADLVDLLTPALEDTGDAERVRRGLDLIRRRGTGARLQRDLVAAGGSFDDVVDAVVARTRN